MPGSTPIYGFPYPLGSDPVRDGDNVIRSLAEDVETAIAPLGFGLVAKQNVSTSSITATSFSGAVSQTANPAGTLNFTPVAGRQYKLTYYNPNFTSSGFYIEPPNITSTPPRVSYQAYMVNSGAIISGKYDIFFLPYGMLGNGVFSFSFFLDATVTTPYSFTMRFSITSTTDSFNNAVTGTLTMPDGFMYLEDVGPVTP
jgi:hypothetical protein